MDSKNFSSNRIAKNTIVLYIRTIVSMLIGIYASRVLLQVLGIEDFGIYNIVGGVVVLFSVFNSSFTVSIQRYMNYEMGRNNPNGVHEVFCTAINIQVLMALIIFTIGEIGGLFLLYNYLTISQERLTAAFWVLQFSILTLGINLISIPYNALIIAKEDMKSFAYIDMLGSILKLCAIYLTDIFKNDYTDKLIVYALLIFISQIIIRFIYSWYCNKKFSESQYKFYINKELVKEMLGFSSWTSLSAISYLFVNQGINILYNRFYGVTINASLGIANQVNAAINGLVSNFTTSLNPQITKSYAAGDLQTVQKLHVAGPKLAFCLMAIVSAPIILNIDYILHLWLLNVPSHTNIFIIIILYRSLINSLVTTSNTVVRSTGKVKSYELCLNGISILFFITSYFFFKIDSDIYTPFLMLLISQLFVNIYVIHRSCKSIHMKYQFYLVNVFLRMILPFTICIIILKLILDNSNNFIDFILQSFISMIAITLSEYFVGLNKEEKLYIRKIISKVIHKNRKYE